ncbi:hypothetical protein WN944_003404 [Citrus x changshan-huyou]|uniref:Myb/SANT-like domain-containing protein n=1 Tax=Citrus x changshan-huyou TaxID=2935761 RepID=A0AAP0LZW4_9ROSI
MATDGVSQGKSKAIWDPKSHEIWVNLIVEQVRVGNRSGTHLSKQGWKNIIENFTAATNKNYDRKQHRNCWDIVKKERQIWDALVRGETWLVTGAGAWAPTSGVTPPLYNHSSFENIIEDDIVLVDSTNSEEVNHDEIGCSDRWKFITEVLNGNDRRCHEMFQMEKHGTILEIEWLKNNFNIQGTILEIEWLKNNFNIQDCIGATNVTHIFASLPVDEQIPYIGRKCIPTQNIMAACDFHMLFIFVWPGWEGTAHDTRIFLKTLKNDDVKFPKPANGKFFTFIIERTFGVWKARWKVLQHMTNFKFDKQVAVVATSMALHNFIRREVNTDLEFESYEGKEDYIPDDEESSINININENEASEMGVVRENIARELMLR